MSVDACMGGLRDHDRRRPQLRRGGRRRKTVNVTGGCTSGWILAVFAGPGRRPHRRRPQLQRWPKLRLTKVAAAAVDGGGGRWKRRGGDFGCTGGHVGKRGRARKRDRPCGPRDRHRARRRKPRGHGTCDLECRRRTGRRAWTRKRNEACCPPTDARRGRCVTKKAPKTAPLGCSYKPQAVKIYRPQALNIHMMVCTKDAEKKQEIKFQVTSGNGRRTAAATAGGKW